MACVASVKLVWLYYYLQAHSEHLQDVLMMTSWAECAGWSHDAAATTSAGP
jgi:hypothetical protein